MLEVFQLRRRGYTLKVIAARFGVSIPSIQAVVKGRSHRHVELDHPDRRACVRAELKKLKARRDEKDRRLKRGWQRRLSRGVMDYVLGYSLRAAAARAGVGLSLLHRELVKRGVPRRPVGKWPKHMLRKGSSHS